MNRAPTISILWISVLILLGAYTNWAATKGVLITLAVLLGICLTVRALVNIWTWLETRGVPDSEF